jgi:hypothetical protein
MFSTLLAFTLAHHNDASPYGWHMSCERWLERSVEIQLDSNLNQESKYNLIAYLRSKVSEECNQVLT